MVTFLDSFQKSRQEKVFLQQNFLISANDWWMSVLFSLIKTKVFLSKEGLAYDYFHYINKNLSNYAL